MTEGQYINGNRRRYTQRNKSDSNNLGNNQPNKDNKPKQREMVFHLHDSTQRKTSESFNKIVEATIIKIEKILTIH